MDVNEIDLFEHYETLPQEVQDVLSKYAEVDTYEQCANMLKECEALGYTFEYYLDAQPYGLRKMNAKDKLSNLYDEVKQEGNCKDYVSQMCQQLELFGTETNSLTKQMVHDKLEEVLRKVKKSLEN